MFKKINVVVWGGWRGGGEEEVNTKGTKETKARRRAWRAGAALFRVNP